MRLLLLTALTMVAFAANSVLTRVALADGWIGPADFAALRLASGAIALVLMVYATGGRVPWAVARRPSGAAALLVYIVGFSFAYLTLDAGVGALILFGTVQVVMFGWSAVRGAAPTPRQLTGAGIAFVGLMLALWPSDGAGGDVAGAVFMVIAGIGWAIYTLAGKNSADPLAATAANFVAAIPVLLILLVGSGLYTAPSGIALAILSGAVTSGLGYALWYTVLPQ